MFKTNTGMSVPGGQMNFGGMPNGMFMKTPVISNTNPMMLGGGLQSSQFGTGSTGSGSGYMQGIGFQGNQGNFGMGMLPQSQYPMNQMYPYNMMSQSGANPTGMGGGQFNGGNTGMMFGDNTKGKIGMMSQMGAPSTYGMMGQNIGGMSGQGLDLSGQQESMGTNKMNMGGAYNNPSMWMMGGGLGSQQQQQLMHQQQQQQMMLEK